MQGGGAESIVPTGPGPTPPTAGTIGSGRTVALRHPLYRWLLLGSLLSFLSVQSMVVARGWLAWELTSSNAAIGGVLLALGVPLALMMPWGGVAADRFPKRALLRWATLVLALTQVLIGTAVVTEVVAYWMLVVGGLVQGTAFSVIAPTRIAFASDLLPPEELPNGVVLQQLALNSSRVVGPSLAGVLVGIETVGIGGVYLISAAIMVGTFLTTFGLPEGLPSETRRRGSPTAELLGGFRHVRDQPELTALVVTSFLVVAAAFPWFGLLPELVDVAIGADSEGFGLVLGASAVGAVAASWLVADRAAGPTGMRLQIGAGVVLAAGVIAIGQSPTLVTAAAAALVIGAAAAVFQAVNNTLALAMADPEYHGRVQGLLMMGFSGFAIVALPLGVFADAVGIRTAYTVMGIGTLVPILAYRAWRQGRPPISEPGTTRTGDPER